MFQMTTRTYHPVSRGLRLPGSACAESVSRTIIRRRRRLRPPPTTPAGAATPATPAATTKDVISPEEAGKLKILNEYIEKGPKAADKLKDIEGLLKDKSPKVRAYAVYALGEIGPAAKDAAPALAESLKDAMQTSGEPCSMRCIRSIPGLRS